MVGPARKFGAPMLEFSGPIKPSFFLTFDEPLTARLSGGDGAARLRVMRGNGYPHDLRLNPDRPATLHAGRVFAPVVDEGARLVLDVATDAHARFLVLCANCFTEMWSTNVAPDALGDIDAAHTKFWNTDEIRDRGCPKCFAAAAKPH